MTRDRFQYYQGLKQMARDLRERHGIEGYGIGRAEMRRVCKACGVDQIDLWPLKKGQKPLKKLPGAYFCDECGCTIMLARSLPDEPAIFTMAHELKHHLVDQDVPIRFCDESNLNEIEIGAEIFAAELIFPEDDFKSSALKMGIGLGRCRCADLVRLKRETGTTLSYAALAKRAEFQSFAPKGILSSYRGWKKLEEDLYGEPRYKQIQRFKAATGRARS